MKLSISDTRLTISASSAALTLPFRHQINLLAFVICFVLGCITAGGVTLIGIPPEEQGRIFERFYQVDGSTKRRFGGTGLGLAIVKAVCDHHGVRLELRESEGGGTLVALFFRSRTGIAMRATAFDQEAARAQGINVGRIFSIAWAIGAVLAAVVRVEQQRLQQPGDLFVVLNVALPKADTEAAKAASSVPRIVATSSVVQR